MCTYVSQNCIVVHNLQTPPHVGGEREYILAVIAVVTASVAASWQQETQFLPLGQIFFHSIATKNLSIPVIEENPQFLALK